MFLLIRVLSCCYTGLATGPLPFSRAIPDQVDSFQFFFSLFFYFAVFTPSAPFYDLHGWLAGSGKLGGNKAQENAA
ncbi:hypothetical protein V8C34DRAFT_282256 [Trichoderma compactum]